MRLYWEVLDSHAWNCLTTSDQRAYIALARQLRSTNNGDLCLTLTQSKLSGIKSQTTLAKSLRALVAVGLLYVTRQGGCKAGGQRLPTLYGLTDLDVFEVLKKHIESRKATNAWKTVTDIEHGQRLIEAFEKQSAEVASRKKSLVQNLIATSPKIGVVEAKTSPKIGPWPSRPVQKLDLAKSAESPAKPITARVSAL